MVVNRCRKGHKECSRTHGCNLGHSAGTRAANDEVGIGKSLRRVFNKRRQFSLHTGSGVIGVQRVNLARAALMRHMRTLSHRNQRQCLRHQLVQRPGPQTAPNHQQLERPTAADKPGGRVRLAHKRRAQRITHPFSLFAQHARKGGEDPIRHTRQQLVDHAGN